MTASGIVRSGVAKANDDVAPLFLLHEDAGAEHGFNMNTSHARALVADSRDRAIAQLRQYRLDHWRHRGPLRSSLSSCGVRLPCV